MKAYIQFSDGFPINVDCQAAADGLSYLGYDLVPFELKDILSDKYVKTPYSTSLFVGSMDGMRAIFKKIGKLPNPIDYPESLQKHVYVNTFKLSEAINIYKTNKLPYFIKPVATKLFDGILISKDDDLAYFNRFLESDPDVYLRNKLNILNEWRAYIYNGKMIDCRCYSGDFRMGQPNFYYIDEIIRDYTDQPIAYTIDVAVTDQFITDDYKNEIIEINDFWAIGNYGVEPQIYAEMLRDRYFEIVK